MITGGTTEDFLNLTEQSLQLEVSKAEIRNDVTSAVSDLQIGKLTILLMIIVTGRPA